jgi:hypothetical protein
MMLGFFMSSSGTRAVPPALLDTGDDDPYDPPTVQEELPLSYIAICFSLNVACKFFISMNIFSWSK